LRLDVFLKSVCLFKQRTRAKRACEGGRVRVGGSARKASYTVHPGDVLEIRTPSRRFEVEVLEVPSRQLPRKEASSCYRILSESRPEEEA
jgi:ribosome-associated heat shock protein Hsp15